MTFKQFKGNYDTNSDYMTYIGGAYAVKNYIFYRQIQRKEQNITVLSVAKYITTAFEAGYKHINILQK